MIRGIYVKNWRSHSESKFEFEKGTNVLVGISGSGKSSVMDAISFGLFGTFPALNARKVKLEDLIRNGQKEAEVVVDFLDDYSVRRVVEKGKGTSTSELRKAGKLIEGIKTGPVTQKVEEILKIDYELFERAVYSEQNQIDYFLRIPRGQRKNKIDQLLGIDQFELARKNCVKLINSLGDSVGEYEKILTDFEGTGAKERKEVEKRLSEAEKGSEKKKKEFDGIEKEKDDVSKKLKKAGEKSEEFIRIKTEVEGLEERRKELEKVVKEKPKAGKSEVEKKVREVEKEIQKRNQLLGEYRVGIDDGENKILEKSELEEKLKGFGERDVVKEYEDSDKDLRKKREELTKLKTHMEFLEKSVEEVGGDSCPMCGRSWDEHMRGEVRTEREAELGKVGIDLEKLEPVISDLEKKVGELELEKEVFENGTERLKELGDPAAAVEKIEKLVEELDGKNGKDEKELQKLRNELEILKAAEELDEVAKEFEKKEKGLKDLKFNLKAYEQLKREYEGVIEKWNSTSRELEGLWTSRDNLRSELNRIEEREKEVEEFGKELEKMRKGEEFLVKFKNSLLDVQEELRLKFVESLNETMSELWETIYPYGDFTDVRLGIVNGDYVLQLKHGEWVDVEGIVSGGERSTAALVLRIGFALALAPHLRVLILDEPTHNLDSQGIRELGNVLREKIHDYVSQVFLITHEERLEQAVSGSLYRLERDKGRKEATKVILVDAA